MQSTFLSGEPLPDNENIVTVKTALRSWHGESQLYCRDCGDYVPVAFRVTGRMKSPYTGDTIFIDYIADAKDHTLKEMSH